MPRIRCHYIDCNFLDNAYCTALTVELDPELGCATYVPLGEADVLAEEWEEDEDSYDDWDAEDLDLDDDVDEEDDFDEEEEDW